MNVTLGTVSHGTMRPEDLIPTFIEEIRHILTDPDSDDLRILGTIDQLEKDTQEPGYFDTESSQFDLDDLFDLLNTLAPEGYYFGSHPGDGSDYGFWECEDEES